jgi:formate-dependent nitrite reductase membrane component NrfD
MTRNDEERTDRKATTRQALGSRVFWFFAGAGLNYILISTPFRWLEKNTALPPFLISACSLGVAASFFFVWNYFVNFRSEARKRDALPRYLAAVVFMWLLSSATLTFLKSFDAHMAFRIASHALDLDIVATQFFLSGLKFFLYHKWVFPLGGKLRTQTPGD